MRENSEGRRTNANREACAAVDPGKSERAGKPAIQQPKILAGYGQHVARVTFGCGAPS